MLIRDLLTDEQKELIKPYLKPDEGSEEGDFDDNSSQNAYEGSQP